MITPKNFVLRTIAKLNNLLGIKIVVSMFTLGVMGVVLGLAVFLFFNSAAPTTLTMLGGEEGSSYRKSAEKYQKILAKQGVKVKVVYSDGSSDNLQKLINPKEKVDVGFVQGGDLSGVNIENLVSLGSVSYQPLMIFYRGDSRKLLSDFEGLRLDIGEAGSGTHSLSLALLKANGIEAGGKTQFVHAASADLINSLLENRVDALFLMGDSVSSEVMRTLMHHPDVRLFNFIQADAYTRRIKYLNKLTLPQGSLDFGKNLPEVDTYLIAPTVELIARKSLHPALSDLLLEAAKEVHGGAGLFRKRGEFPAALQHEIPLSEQALDYYKSGKSFLYDTFPFWLASLLNRIIIVLLPIILLLIPAMRIAPSLYRWRIESRIYPWYSVLLELERDAFSASLDAKRRDELLHRLNHLEHAVNKIKIPATFGDLFYGLRGHIAFVRDRLRAGTEIP